ncbi:MAG: hypothetical protein K0R94_1030, partial [Burkholderiales bacterium]|nr:hypothetical protein [Burkholderiales bacterium]
NALYKNAHYGKKESSKIFNNTEAVFLFNQALYLLMYMVNLENNKSTKAEINMTTCTTFLKKMGNFIFGKMDFDFKKPIFDSSTYIPFNIKITAYKKYADKVKYFLEIKIGLENNFLCNGIVFELTHDLHGFTA